MKTICVFCSSSDGVDEAYHQTATDLGNRIGKLRLDLIYGGASIGLMGAVARGVHDKGGRVVGVIPEFFRKKDETIEYEAFRAFRSILGIAAALQMAAEDGSQK